MALNRIVAKKSTGYGYKYASLSDIVAAGFEIPKTKTVTEADGRDFLYYYDAELKEWLRGAEIVIPESKGMNKAQLFGSGLSYALRYTTTLANRIATSEDEVIEDIDDKGESKKAKAKRKEQEEAIAKAEEGIIADLRSQMYAEKMPWQTINPKQIDWILKNFKLEKKEDITQEHIDKAMQLAKEKKNGKN